MKYVRILYLLGVCQTLLNAHNVQTLIQEAIKQQDNKQDKGAIETLERALAIDPDCFDAHMRLGPLYRHFDQFDKAIFHFRSAVRINPNHTAALLELANTLNTVDRPDECLGLYKKVLELAPQSLAALYNLGYTLKKIGHIHEALDVYNAVLEKNPDYALARFSRSLTYLALGNFEQGWQEYEWRWGAYNETPKKFKQPMWDGSSLKGKRILIYAEQGLGDTLQFIRYGQLLKEQGAYVIFQTQKPLQHLLSHCCPYLDKVICTGDALPDFDVQAALMSLPHIMKTRLETIPSTIPYIFPDPSLIESWKTKLSSKTFNVGICWQGNANYSTQFLRQAVAAKSMHVKNFQPIAQLENVTLYNLQKIYGTEQMNEIKDLFTVEQFPADFDESHGRFMDTAAVIKNLDLVITVDTSIAHLAGALGVPTWVPLPFPGDWRWMLEREDTPWYPTMRLFRLKKGASWDTVMTRIAHELQQHIPTKKNMVPSACHHEKNISPEQRALMQQLDFVNAHLNKLKEHAAYPHRDNALYYATNMRSYLMQRLAKLS